MDLITKIFNSQQTYIELGVQQVKLVQSRGAEVSYDRTFERVTDNLNFYLQHLNSNPKSITLLIPTVNLFLRTLDLPREAEGRLAEIIKFQFLDQLPCQKEEVYFTYYLAQKSEQRIKVLVFAVLKDYLDDIYHLCHQAGVKVKAIIPVPLVYYVFYKNKSNAKKNTLYMDSCLGYFNFTFFSSNNIYLRGSQTKEIKETKYYLLQELEQVVNFVEVSKTRPTEFWLSVDQVGEAISEHGFIDLSSQMKSELKRRMKIIASLIVVFFIVNFMLQGYFKRIKLQEIETKLNQVQPVVRQLKEFDRQITAARRQTEQLKQEIKWQDNYLPWIIELNTVLKSQRVVIEQLNFSGSRLVLLAGTAPSASAVMDNLEQSAYFNNLNFTGTIETLNNGERFKIEGDLNYEVD